MRKRLGRPGADPEKVKAARRYLAQGMGVSKTAKLAGETGTVQRLKQAVAARAERCGGGKELLVPHYHERRGDLPK